MSPELLAKIDTLIERIKRDHDRGTSGYTVCPGCGSSNMLFRVAFLNGKVKLMCSDGSCVQHEA